MKIGHTLSGSWTIRDEMAPFGRGMKLARFLHSMLRMKNTAHRNRKGSVLMEYLVALVFIGAALMVASTTLFYSPVSNGSAGDPRVNPKGFGEMGRSFVGFYQRVMGGLSLPVP